METSRILQSSRSRSQDIDFPPVIYLIICAGILMLCAPCVYAKISRRIHDRIQRNTPRVDEAIGIEFADAIISQLRESMRRMELEYQTSELPAGISKEYRIEYIDNVLITKKVILGDHNDGLDEGSADPSSNENEDTLVLKPRSQDEGNDGDDGTDARYDVCAICMEEYRDADEIGCSHNSNCSHYFHKSCIREWLTTHEDCPCCRKPYLSFGDDIEEGHSAVPVPETNQGRGAGPSGISRLELEQTLLLARGMELFYRLRQGPNASSGGSAFPGIGAIEPPSSDDSLSFSSVGSPSQPEADEHTTVDDRM